MKTKRACVVKVNYIGVVHHLLDSTEEEYSLPLGSKIKDLLQRLVERHGEKVASCILRSDGQLISTVKIFLNNGDISRYQGLDTPINGESQISILVGLIPIQGG